jgi:hypothetical protein
MVVPNNFPPFFRVEMAGYFGRTHEIAEKDR